MHQSFNHTECWAPSGLRLPWVLFSERSEMCWGKHFFVFLFWTQYLPTCGVLLKYLLSFFFFLPESDISASEALSPWRRSSDSKKWRDSLHLHFFESPNKHFSERATLNCHKERHFLIVYLLYMLLLVNVARTLWKSKFWNVQINK